VERAPKNVALLVAGSLLATASTAQAAAPNTYIDRVYDADSGDNLIDEDGSGVENIRAAFHGDGIGAAKIRFRCRVDSQAYVTCTSPWEWAVGVGQHTLVVQAYNVRTGERDATPASRSFTIQPLATTPPPPPGGDITLPARAAFYYPWFPETWTVNGAHVFYHPDLGYYSSDAQAVADAHIRALDYGKVKVAIASWWGQNQHAEQARIPLLMDRTAAFGSSVKWTLYYEKEGGSNPTVAQLQADLAYVSSRYANRPEFARAMGKPVIFVYNANDTTCEVADRWRQAAGSNWYLVLKVFPGFATCANQPSAWHQYGPASPAHSHDKSYVISPGFWRADEAGARLARDPARFAQNVRDMVASGKSWQIVTSFNEWGEGTAVEGAQEWSGASGFGTYLDILHNEGGASTPAPR
jgi:hypothetical protein